MQQHSDIIGMSIKHGVTEAFLDDMLLSKNGQDDPSLHYTTGKGVKKALLRNSGLVNTLLPACPEFQRALSILENNSLETCTDCDESAKGSSSFEYIEVWDRIKAQLENESSGAQLRNYYRSMLSRVSSENASHYIDFHSGSVFKEVVSQLGGVDSVMDDIFLSLSADGVQPFNSDEYSCCPVVATVLNLAPSDRYKSKNLLPLLIVPGPKNPKDLTSFLRPFLDEMKELSTVCRMVQMYTGERRRVRVHLLFVLADLPAMKKLTHLKGHNGLVPCRFCNIRGVYVSHVYFPSIATEVVGNSNSKKRRGSGLKQFWDPAKLPKRTDQSVQQAYNDLHCLP